MRQVFFVTALSLLAGCSSGSLPQRNAFAATAVHGVAAPASARRGIYVALGYSTSNGVLGYPVDNRTNKKPFCTEPLSFGADLATDRDGNLMVAQYSAGVYVYQGPRMCGPLLEDLNTDGITADVASSDAVNGKIVAANIYSDSSNVFGAVVICTLSGGCTTLRNQSVLAVYGVALAHNGDCWGSAEGYNGRTDLAILVYFKGCTGTGQLATGFKNVSAGGLDLDGRGNLIAVDPGQGFWVYHGCNPTCRVRGGLMPAQGETEYGHLNKDGTKFVAADLQYGQVDVYSYRHDRLRYKYSFNNGISTSSDVAGAAYSPR